MPVLTKLLAVCDGPFCNPKARLDYEVEWHGDVPSPTLPYGWGLWAVDGRGLVCCRGCLAKFNQGLEMPQRARHAGL